MQLQITDGWMLFCIAFAVVLLTSLIMSLQANNFYTFRHLKRKFSIMELQFPANRDEIATLINGIYVLPKDVAARSVKALKGQLWIDFLFMPAAYGAIFLLCMMFSWKMPTYGSGAFVVLAWLQVIPWCCDMTENIFLLGKIKNNTTPLSKSFFLFYKWIVITKWTISLFALVCALSAGLYFWLSGHYDKTSLMYLLILLVEMAAVIFIAIAAKRIFKPKQPEASDY